MGYAYNEIYIDDAMRCLGEAMDYAVNCYKLEMDMFLDMFIVGGFAKQFEAGVPKIISGVSGTELVMDVVMKAGWEIEYPEVQIEYDYSETYWCGWILAYYQWYSGKSFKDIQKYLPMKEIEKLYGTLHEAAEEKVVEVFEVIINKKNCISKLQMQRRLCAYSQRLLAEKSGVNLRTLQQYEVRAKDINKAAGETLKSLSKALGCRIEDIIE